VFANDAGESKEDDLELKAEVCILVAIQIAIVEMPPCARCN